MVDGKCSSRVKSPVIENKCSGKMVLVRGEWSTKTEQMLQNHSSTYIVKIVVCVCMYSC